MFAQGLQESSTVYLNLNLNYVTAKKGHWLNEHSTFGKCTSCIFRIQY